MNFDSFRAFEAVRDACVAIVAICGVVVVLQMAASCQQQRDTEQHQRAMELIKQGKCP